MQMPVEGWQWMMVTLSKHYMMDGHFLQLQPEDTDTVLHEEADSSCLFVPYSFHGSTTITNS